MSLIKNEFNAQLDFMKEKYAENIKGISAANNVDMGVAFDMLVYNYRTICMGDFTEVKRGGGIVDYAELGADIKKLDAARRK